MKYICQLTDGYMLAQIFPLAYKVVRTGYPYPDTPLPSNVMLEHLKKKINVSDPDDRYTIKYLIKVLTPYFESDRLLTDKMLKEIIETGILGSKSVLSKNEVCSVFFDCKFFSIYYVECIENSVLMDRMKTLLEGAEPEKGWVSVYIIHWHKGKNTIQLPKMMDKHIFETYDSFESLLREEVGVSVHDFKSQLDDLYDSLPKLNTDKVMLIPDYDFEQASCYTCVQSKNVDSCVRGLVREIMSTIGLLRVFSSEQQYKTIVLKTLKEVYGYNVLIGIYERNNAIDKMMKWKLVMYCSIYSVGNAENKKLYGAYIKDLINDLIRTLHLDFSRFNVILDEDENAEILCSPFIYAMAESGIWQERKYNIFQTNLLCNRAISKKDLVKTKLGVRYAVNLKSLFGDEFSSYERKLLQFFVLARFYSNLGLSIFDMKEGHTKFSYQNLYKALLKNYERLVLMGEVDEFDDDKCFISYSIRYGYRFTMNPSKDYVTELLDVALDETDEFTEEEKSFIMLMPHLIFDIKQEGNKQVFIVDMLSPRERSNRKTVYKTNFRDGFIESIRTVFELFALANICTLPVSMSRVWKSCSRDFSYFDDVFCVIFE